MKNRTKHKQAIHENNKNKRNINMLKELNFIHNNRNAYLSL